MPNPKRCLGTGGGWRRYPMSPSSLSNAELMASVPPFRKTTQSSRPSRAAPSDSPVASPANPTASTYPSDVCAAMIGHSAGRVWRR